ncbi:MAG: signal recognition particle receptor subunit alpha, partial [Caulobacteraceae bacterium]
MTTTPDAAPKTGWFKRLTTGLQRSSRHLTDQVVGNFVRKPLDMEALDRLEEMLIESDLGPDAAARITEA